MYETRIRCKAKRVPLLPWCNARPSRAAIADSTSQLLDELRQSEPTRHVTTRIQRNVVANTDPRLIRIAIDNLVRNAWKFSSRVALPVIEFGSETQAGELSYYVRDNGAGFDMRRANRLFSAFQRMHSEREFPGTGIGLATTRRVVARQGGRIWADARVGYGATFHFTLP